MTARVKGKVRRGTEVNLLASVLSNIGKWSSMENEVNKGKEGKYFE